MALATPPATESTSLLVSFPHVTRLELLYNNLSYTAFELNPLVAMTNLQHLDLASNPLMRVPECVCSLAQLASLNIQSTRISQLPESFSQLRKLNTLILSNNQLPEFPQVLAALPSLTTLHLSSNRIQHLDHAIGTLAPIRIRNGDTVRHL